MQTKLNIKTKEKSGISTYPEHNCFAWNTEVWQNSSEYNLIECMVCGRITHFAFKSFWLRLRFLFWNRINTIRGNRQTQE